MQGKKGDCSGNVFQQRFSDGNNILRRFFFKSIIEKWNTDAATISTFVGFPFLSQHFHDSTLAIFMEQIYLSLSLSAYRYTFTFIHKHADFFVSWK